MSFPWMVLVLALGLFLGMVLLEEIGRRLGKRRLAQDPEGLRAGAAAIEGAVFALLGLLVAFTFSGAAARYDARRRLIVEEANAIGTAYLRLDLLPKDAQPAQRELFRKYLDSRLEVYRKLPDLDAAQHELARNAQLQIEIWNHAVAASHGDKQPTSTAVLLLPALNQMIDITTTRTRAGHEHPPTIIFVMLFGLSLGCAVMAGYGTAASQHRSWTHVIGFAAVMAVTVYVILEVEYPRLGLIRLDAADQVLVELRASMK